MENVAINFLSRNANKSEVIFYNEGKLVGKFGVVWGDQREIIDMKFKDKVPGLCDEGLECAR